MVGPGNSEILEVLDRSKTLGFLGPGPISDHIQHATSFVAAARDVGIVSPEHLIDLGSGGGVPGLIVAGIWTETEVVLLDGSTKRCEFLHDAATALGLEGRVSVRCGRAEELAHTHDLRGWADLVVARSFAAPAITAECAAGLLHQGGNLIVSEPPDEPAGGRWDAKGLSLVGMGDPQVIEVDHRFVSIPQTQRCPDRYPRRVGVPAKRPLF